MVVGFNHNFRYKGEVYHVQTEDGGVKNPQVVTLLYAGGTILSSKKTSYADICQQENLTPRVEALMKEQHKEMLRRLKDGEFDEVIGKRKAGAAVPPPKPAAEPASLAPAVKPAEPPPAAAPVPAAAESKAKPAPAAAEPKEKPTPAAASLDDIILSYFIGDDN